MRCGVGVGLGGSEWISVLTYLVSPRSFVAWRGFACSSFFWASRFPLFFSLCAAGPCRSFCGSRPALYGPSVGVDSRDVAPGSARVPQSGARGPHPTIRVLLSMLFVSVFVSREYARYLHIADPRAELTRLS